MTFYWWSHWFWITLLSNTLIHIAVVQTYPSQEISLEYNQNSKPQKTITKLYQTTTALTWATTTTPHLKAMDTAGEKTILQSVTPEVLRRVDEDVEPGSTTVEEVDDGSAEPFQAVDASASASDEELEFKRSAENYNKTTAGVGQVESRAAGGQSEEQASVVAMQGNAGGDSDTAAADSTVKLKRDDGEINNYTNFSRTPHAADTNSTSGELLPSAGDSAAPPQQAPKLSSTAPAAPKIDSTHATLEWLNAMAAAAAAPPPTVTPAASHTVDKETVTVAQRIPFTLENANKEEELRRAESEHRSRKSKVLSAEYKHINRFINYSADTKSLLTRSASTAPNDFDGADESNISSEALSIQRTYFLDAGAISAICFTIFGVCCTVGTIGIALYRRRYLNKPQALSEPDSSVYIDDSTMRDNSDEMYSLDNDSFLNSLEAMTIQNYWTDTVKHTKL